jgi:hypothetical protein
MSRETDLFTTVLAGLVSNPARHDFYELYDMLKGRIAALEAENKRMADILAELHVVVTDLVGDEAAITDFDPEWEHTSCNYCGNILIRRLPEERAATNLPHAEGCPVVRARALLECDR